MLASKHTPQWRACSARGGVRVVAFLGQQSRPLPAGPFARPFSPQDWTRAKPSELEVLKTLSVVVADTGAQQAQQPEHVTQALADMTCPEEPKLPLHPCRSLDRKQDRSVCVVWQWREFTSGRHPYVVPLDRRDGAGQAVQSRGLHHGTALFQLQLRPPLCVHAPRPGQGEARPRASLVPNTRPFRAEPLAGLQGAVQAGEPTAAGGRHC
jgi:hypothetical protein